MPGIPQANYTPSENTLLLLALMQQAQRQAAGTQPNQGSNPLSSAFGNLLSSGAGGAGGTAATSAGSAATAGAGDIGSLLSGANSSTPFADSILSGGAPYTNTAAGQSATSLLSGGTGGGQGAFSLGGIGSAGNAILPIAGALGAYDVFKNGRTGTRGALQGAASGAAIGSTFGPIGTGVGAIIGGTAGYLNRYGDKDMWKTEGNQLRDLQKKGTYIPQGLIDSMPRGGRSTAELIARAKASNGNVKFAESRNEGDLTPTDIVGYSAFAKNDPMWFKKPLQERLDLAQKALAAGAVREHHGTIDVDWSKLGTGTTPAAGTKPTTGGNLTLGTGMNTTPNFPQYLNREKNQIPRAIPKPGVYDKTTKLGAIR